MEFKCLDKENNISWFGRIDEVIGYGSHYEIRIISRSSITLVLGKTSQGGVACMPDFSAGCYLVNLCNRFWNTEKLINVLGRVDGITVAEALYWLGFSGTIPANLTEP